MAYETEKTYDTELAERIASIELCTVELEQIPLDAFHTESFARSIFLRTLDEVETDIVELANDIGMAQRDLVEIKELGLGASYEEPKEEFLAAGRAILERFVARYRAIKPILDGTHADIDEFCLEEAQSHVAHIEYALRGDILSPHPSPLE